MKYIARPVEVDAQKIVRVNGQTPPAGFVPIDMASQSRVACYLESGAVFYPTFGMISRMLPKPGDYVVTQEDGYVYLNPKDVFERKYAPADPSGARLGLSPGR